MVGLGDGPVKNTALGGEAFALAPALLFNHVQGDKAPITAACYTTLRGTTFVNSANYTTRIILRSAD